MKEFPFERYKDFLIPYLKQQGIEAELGQTRCCPWHDDSSPSFSVFTGDDGHPAFNCFGCGRGGDIYKAVEYCTGETDSKKQFEQIERLFGNGEHASEAFTRPQPEPKPPAFTPDPAALAKLTEWLQSLKDNGTADPQILKYFSDRAAAKSGGKVFQYPAEVLPELPSYFYYWPGKNAAEKAVGKLTLFAAGVPFRTRDASLPPERRQVAWYHPGILTKSPEGFKLLFMDGIDSRKMNPRAGVSFFPIPSELPEGGSIILLEGEIDAIMCRTIGIKNTFSMGGKEALTKPRIAKYIIPKNLAEITLFADNDKNGASQKKFGLLPVSPEDGIRETVPGNLRKMGYRGAIKLAVLPDGCGFKDPDDAIRNGRADLVRATLDTAVPYSEPDKPAAPAAPKKTSLINLDTLTEWDSVPLKFLSAFLKKFKYEELENDERLPALNAIAKASKDKAAPEVISEWTGGAFGTGDISTFAKADGTPFPLIAIAQNHDLSPYMITRLQEFLVPAIAILNSIQELKTTLPLKKTDYDTLSESQEFQAFLLHPDHAFASYVVARALKNKFLYIQAENANFAFKGNYWESIPSIATESHAVLVNTLREYLRKYPREKNTINNILSKIGSNSFRQKLASDLNYKAAQFFHDEKNNPILFDSLPVRETLTLQDGVLDFSGDELKTRSGRAEEYRLIPLPYTKKQIMDAPSPELFLKLIDLDFNEPKPDVLEKNPVRTKDTLLYYLSLILSRNVSKNYSCFMTGPGGTGKSTLISALTAILGNNNIARLQSQILVAKKKGFDNGNGPTPELAALEGKLLSVTMELPEGGRINGEQLKLLTGNDLISARQLHKDLHQFLPTAQVVIVGNSLPGFSKHDSGIIRRLLVFHFNIEHAKRARTKEHRARYKGVPSDPAKILDKLREEAPGIIKLLAKKYIELKKDYNLDIPLSQECINAKSQYIEMQNKETDEFYEACITHTPDDNESFIFSRDMYQCYLNFMGYQEDSPDALKQKAFIAYLKADHQELLGGNYCQKRRPGGLPEWGFKFASFTETGLEYLSNTPNRSQQPELTSEPPPMPEDNPFPELPDIPLTDEDGIEIDIF